MAQDEAAAGRKVRMALAKRQLNRLRGPYHDPIKTLIRKRVEVHFKRRLKASNWAQLVGLHPGPPPG